jgi:DNA-binding response OmpR family regulator
MSMRILVIDDDVAVLRTTEMILMDAGYECLTASDGEAGLQLFRTSPPNLVITDIIMPRKEGIETIIAIRRQQPKAKIIAMSGGGRTRNKELLSVAASMGANGVLSKPFEPDELVALVERTLSAG